jgi:hypothetical protein
MEGFVNWRCHLIWITDTTAIQVQPMTCRSAV